MGGHTPILPPATFAAVGQVAAQGQGLVPAQGQGLGPAQGQGLLLPPGFPLSDNNHNHNHNNNNHYNSSSSSSSNNNSSHHMLYDPNNGNVGAGMVPIANPGCRFCHIAVMYEGSMYTFGE